MQKALQGQQLHQCDLLCEEILLSQFYGLMQVDPVFEGLDGGAGSLIKYNPLSNVSSAEVWNFLRAMVRPVTVLQNKADLRASHIIATLLQLFLLTLPAALCSCHKRRSAWDLLVKRIL